MKVINISEKVVGIGDFILMPGDEKSLTRGQVEVPGVRVLAEMKILKIEEEAEDKKAPKKEPVSVEESAEEPEKKAASKPRKTKKAN